jgi:UDP-N-acetylmuramyl pentapeptide phosphotransferase/UDP-N-acetylglucosamine-1-phosphate transferase
MHQLISATLAFLISLVSVWLIKTRLSKQMLDIPNERSSHNVPTPRGGGLGFIIAFAVTIPLLLPLVNILPIYLIFTPLVVIGLIDDQQGVPSSVRYLVQIVTASIAVYYFGAFSQPWLTNEGILGSVVAIGLTLIAFTAIINFYNFMDGLDGIVAGCSLVQVVFLAFYLQQPSLWLLAAALLGFLYWNWSPAKIFMGDSGSTFLGAMIAVSLLSEKDPVIAWSGLAITLPLVTDSIYTLICRLRDRENIFQAHRRHLFQRLQQSGLTHATVASLYILTNLAIGILLWTLPGTGAFVSLALVLGTIFMGEVYLSKMLQENKSSI